MNKITHWLRRGGFTIAALFIAFWAFMGVGEMLGGDPSGIVHLVPALLVAGAALLARKRPLAGSLTLLALGLAGLAYFLAIINRPEGIITVVALVGGPLLLSGSMLLLAWRIAGMQPAQPS